jgi:outer membrane translocation and assembly module TamA
VSVGWFTEQRLYVDGNPDFPEGGSGSHNSDPDNYVEGEGWHNWLVLNFKYVLPTGTRRGEAIESVVLDAGIPVAGSRRPGLWNPTRSGTTLLQMEPFIFYRTIEPETGRQQGYTGGLGLSLLYDNRDFSPNPSRGSATTLGAAGGAGLDDVSRSWTSLRGKYSKYLSLGESRRIRQQVLAFNAWTAYTPTWDDDEEVQEIFDRVPPQMGASLGGFLRLRGFPLYRFQDKAAIYYGAEYRVIPRWNPLGQISWLRWLQIDWWQFVPFVELGRVAPSWDLQELHSDMKWDAGLGLRLMTAKVVVRGDFAYSEEGWHIWAMVGQAF